MNPKRVIPHSRPTLGLQEQEAVIELLRNGDLSSGRTVRRFEKAMARFIGVKDAVATSSGTAALHLAFLALGIQEGHEVILPSFVCTSPLHALSYVGAKARLVDIGEDFNLSVPHVKRSLSRFTQAILIPHTFGCPAPLSDLKRLGVSLIEDCAQSLGASYAGKRVGSFGALSVFSFYTTKVIATGEGGMVLSNHHRLLNKIRDLRDYDEKRRWKVRYNYKMTDLQAALGLVQLERLPQFIQKRKEIAKRYTLAFQKYPIQLPLFPDPVDHIFYRYVLRTPKLTEILSRLVAQGIIARRPIFRPLHRYLGSLKLYETDRAFREALSIPIYPSLKENKVTHIIQIVCNILEQVLGVSDI